MLSKCANPACGARFRYLHEGRIFNLPLTPPSSFVRSAPTGTPEKIEHFWLCGQCALTLKVVMENGTPAVWRLHLELSAGDPVASPAEEKIKVA